MFVRNCKITGNEIKYKKIQVKQTNSNKRVNSDTEAPTLSKKQRNRLQAIELRKKKKERRNQNLMEDVSPAPDQTGDTKEEEEEEEEEVKESENMEEERPYESVNKILFEDEELYEPELFTLVTCAVCETEVGVIDSESVYHFYNVLPSNC